MKQFGNEHSLNKRLIIERASSASVLSNFYCGIEELDNFIHDELQGYIDMGSCKLYIAKEDDDIVGMFCLDSGYLTLSEAAKENMREGVKPISDSAPLSSDAFYWLKPVYEATEITYLAVAKTKQRQNIGSSLIEGIMQKVSQSDEYSGDFVTVRAFNHGGYTAIPFYKNCGFFPAMAEKENQNLFMYRVVIR